MFHLFHLDPFHNMPGWSIRGLDRTYSAYPWSQCQHCQKWSQGWEKGSRQQLGEQQPWAHLGKQSSHVSQGSKPPSHLHCSIKFYLQNTNAKIKLRYLGLQTFNSINRLLELSKRLHGERSLQLKLTACVGSQESTQWKKRSDSWSTHNR